MKISRLLVANRGEIACRIFRTCRRLGIHAIAVYSDADRDALHVRLADEAHRVGPAAARESYLDMDAILAAARASRADAIHPGYGFLSENAAFAEACGGVGIRFVGPGTDAIRAMGLKHEAKAIVAAAGVPVVPGYMGEEQSEARLVAEAARVGFPLLVKAVAGGGGKGMRVVREAAALPEALRGARSEAESAFGDGRLMLERFLERPRHVEVQVFGDAHGNCVHLFERECSVQRRYQKIIEESPSPFIDAATRAAMTAAAVRAAKAVGYVNAGTIEFIVGGDGAFYFMEMNTRLQVEHPVTELVTGLDLVEWQLRVASGESLPLRQEAIQSRGHAIEARIYSEDPRRGFLPSVGRVRRFAHPPASADWRIDSGIADGDAISVHYDPMIAKVVASGADRAAALASLRRNLDRTAVFGVGNNLALLRTIARHPAFAAGDVDTGFVDRELAVLTADVPPPPEALLLAASLALADRAPPAGAGHSPWQLADGWRAGGEPVQAIGLRTPAFLRLRARRQGGSLVLEGEGTSLRGTVAIADGRYLVDAGRGPQSLELIRDGEMLQVVGESATSLALAPAWPFERSVEDADAHPASPLPGRVVDLRVKAGDRVEKGEVLAVVEGMKMQHAIRAGRAGRILQVLARQGELVDAEAILFDIGPA
ncbi:MAG TPA: biotin carboxylase N-terminal domain-containing protein [Steroidobacteraceae bacterium]|nr:biotin carboxylase N-terminal domain-containing protein [Steroidobacteraceae bacterium]